MGAHHRRPDALAALVVINAFIQHHNDIGANRFLVFDRQFRRKGMLAAVNMGTEDHTVVINPAQFRKAVELIPPAVSEDGAVPIHELVQAAHFLKRRDAGTQI